MVPNGEQLVEGPAPGLTDAPARLSPTHPRREMAAVLRHFGSAGVILEYGSGGSTFVAAESSARLVMSVESDPAWASMVARSLAFHCPGRPVHVHHADIGPTKLWGHPVDKSRVQYWPLYATGIWQQPYFEHPDVVLIDGRFRMHCLLTVMQRAERPVVVLFDDYVHRQQFHWIEQTAQPRAIHGRMVEFEIRPGMPLPVEHPMFKQAPYRPG